MQRFLRRAVAAAGALAVFAGCTTEDIVFAGGTPGPAVAIAITNSLIEMRAGETITLGMQGQDEAGNPISAQTPSIATCDGGIVSAAAGPGNDTWAATATVTAVGMGETCLNVTLGSLAEELTVRVGPGAMAITGDPIVGFDVLATDPADNTFQFGTDLFDVSGGAASGTASLSWTSTDESIFTVDASTGEIVTLGLGSATLQVRGDGGASAALPITVAAPALDGTADVSSGGQGTVVTLTANAGEEPFDANTEAYVDFGSVRAWIDAFTANSLTLVVPTTGVDGRGDIVLRNVGPNDVDRRVVFDLVSGTDDRYAPGNYDPSTAPDFDANATANGNIYFTMQGASDVYGGPDPSDWFAISAGGADRTITVTMNWFNGNTDADLFVCTDASLAVCSASQDYNPPSPPTEQVMNVVIPAGMTYVIGGVMFINDDAQAEMQINVQG